MTKVKFPIHYNGASICDRKDKGGFRAILHAGGKQFTKTNKQIAVLKAWIDRNSGIVREGKTPLTNTENVEYRKALAELPEGVTLLDAVKICKETLVQKEALKHGKQFGAGVDLFLQDCLAGGVKPPTYKNYKHLLMRAARVWKDVPLPSITTEDVRELLKMDAGKAQATRNQYHKLLTIFFNFAESQNWISRNPAKPIKRQKIDFVRPEVYTAEQAQLIMDTAQRMDAEAVPYFALCLFAGVRPMTTERLSWGEHIQANNIVVKLEVSKTDQDYPVPIRPNLKAWLDLTPPERRKGRLFNATHDQLKYRLGKVMKESGVKGIKDGARHTFASSVCALEGEAAAVAQLGHQSPSMLYRHYRTLIDKEQAKAFFDIFPKPDPIEFTIFSTGEGSVPNLVKSLPKPCRK
jgi:integrase